MQGKYRIRRACAKSLLIRFVISVSPTLAAPAALANRHVLNGSVIRMAGARAARPLALAPGTA